MHVKFVRSYSDEPSVSGSVESHPLSGAAAAAEEAEQVEDVSADRSRMGQRIPAAQEEQPSTSSGVQIDRVSQERHEVSQGLSVLPRSVRFVKLWRE